MCEYPGEVTMERGNMKSILTIKNIKPGDDGQYKCTIAAPNAPELIHTFKIASSLHLAKQLYNLCIFPVPAYIESMTPSSAVVEVIAGKDLTLTCKAVGYPTPRTTWFRPEGEMPDGSHEILNETIRFQNVSQKHSGVYVCRAYNGLAEADDRQVEVVVNKIPLPENVEGLFFGPGGGRLIAEKRFRVGLNFELTMMIKPRSTNGILAGVTGRRDYLLLQMVNGSVHFIVDNGRGAITTVFEPDHPEQLCDGQWHRINAVKSKNVVILSVNKIFAKPGIGLDDSTDTNNPLIFGFHPRPKGVMMKVKATASYSGCMKDVVVDGKALKITDEKIFGDIQTNICPFF